MSSDFSCPDKIAARAEATSVSYIHRRKSVPVLAVICALAFTSVLALADGPLPTAPNAQPPRAVLASPPRAITSPSKAPTVIRPPSPTDELNTLLMHSTFLIVGPTKIPNQYTFGTVFLMGIPYKGDAKVARIVIVTAAHVFEGISGDTATLQLVVETPMAPTTPFPISSRLEKADSHCTCGIRRQTLPRCTAIFRTTCQ